MTAQITGLVSRAAAGLRAPKSVNKNITPEKGGVAIHYGGPAVSAAKSDAGHDKCLGVWKAWQDYHMDGHGWVDIAYTGGFCNHGYAFVGRGAKIRTAANGTNAGNQNYYAVVWLGGDGQVPTQKAYDAADWWVNELRKADAGRSVKPHKFFHSTGCPGSALVAYAGSRDGKDIDLPHAVTPHVTPKPTPHPAVSSNIPDFPLPVGYYFGAKTGPKESVSGYFSHREDLRKWQKQMIARGWNFGPAGADGYWGPSTEKVVLAFRREKYLPVVPKIDFVVWQAAWTKPVT